MGGKIEITTPQQNFGGVRCGSFRLAGFYRSFENSCNLAQPTSPAYLSAPIARPQSFAKCRSHSQHPLVNITTLFFVQKELTSCVENRCDEMAEALAVVGIVANIIQLVDFGSRVLKRLKEYQTSRKYSATLKPSCRAAGCPPPDQSGDRCRIYAR